MSDPMLEWRARQKNARQSAGLLLLLISLSGALGIAYLKLEALHTPIGVGCVLLLEVILVGAAMFLTRRWSTQERLARVARQLGESNEER